MAKGVYFHADINILCMIHPALFAVVVTYRPEISCLARMLEALAPQVATVIIVDNGSSCDLATMLHSLAFPHVELVQMPENIGLAAAQNVGIAQAMDRDADFILLLDQDSIPSSTMVRGLLEAIVLSQRGPVAAAGPATVDRRTGKHSFFVTEQRRIPRRWQPPKETGSMPHALEVSFLIASGSLLSVEALRHIGVMRAQYFIDHIDTEWCFRARAAGYVLLGVPGVTLEHCLGDSVKTVWFFGFRQVMFHTPLRDYYMFRNTLLLLRDVPVSWIWTCCLLTRLAQFAGYFLTFADNRNMRFRCMLQGIRHGLQGTRGRFDLETGQCHRLPSSLFEPGVGGAGNDWRDKTG